MALFRLILVFKQLIFALYLGFHSSPIGKKLLTA